MLNFFILVLVGSFFSSFAYATAGKELVLMCGKNKANVHACATGSSKKCDNVFQMRLDERRISIGLSDDLYGPNEGKRVRNIFPQFKNMSVYGGLTLYRGEFGYTETYSGKGIKDGGAIVAIENYLVKGISHNGVAKFFAYGEDDQVNIQFQLHCEQTLISRK